LANHSDSVDDLAFQIRLNPTIVFTFLVSVIVLLLATSLALTTLVYVVEASWLPYWNLGHFLFNLEETHNVHGWYEASLLLLCGVLLAGIGGGYIQAGRRWFGLGWCWLASGFLYLSLDVVAARMDLQHSLTSQSGPALAWGVPIAFAIGVLPFLKDLPPDTRRDFVIALCVLGFGAVVLDRIAVGLGPAEVRPFSSRVVSNVEEAVEMLGVAMAIRAALAYLAVHYRGIVVRTPVAE
jgi:hypothetical protein